MTKGVISLYNEIGKEWGEPFLSAQLEVVRLQPMNVGNWLHGYIIGDRLMHNGKDVTDFEHDNAWMLRMEIVTFTMHLLDAQWTEIRGVVMEYAAYDPDGVQPEVEKCTECTGKESHWISDRYIPPKKPGYNGRYAVVRIGTFQ